MESHEYDEMLRTLVRIAVHQETINADVRTCIQELRENVTALQTIAADTHTTLARVETLLARMLRQDGNGTDA